MAWRETDPLTVLKAFVADCGGQKAAAVKLGCSPQFVGQIVHGQKRVPESMFRKLGLRHRIVAKTGASE